MCYLDLSHRLQLLVQFHLQRRHTRPQLRAAALLQRQHDVEDLLRDLVRDLAVGAVDPRVELDAVRVVHQR